MREAYRLGIRDLSLPCSGHFFGLFYPPFFPGQDHLKSGRRGRRARVAGLIFGTEIDLPGGRWPLREGRATYNEIAPEKIGETLLQQPAATGRRASAIS